MHVIVTGGRDFKDASYVMDTLDKFHKDLNITLLIQGGAMGVDLFARVWAEANSIRWKQVDADWNAHGRSAGPIRNRKMLKDYPLAVVLAFPGGKGTADMIEAATEGNRKVIMAMSWREFTLRG